MTEQENNLNNKQPNNFGVPEGYFQKSSQSIFNKIEWQEEHKEFPILLKYRNDKIFGLPENYFEKKENRLELLDYKKLSSLKKQNSFSIPQNYFEENEERLTILLAHETKVISLFSRKVWYAAAAALFVAFGVWAYQFYSAPAQVEDCDTLACLDKTDLINAKTLNNLDNDELYNMVNLEELEQRLNADKASETNFENEEESSDEI